MTCAPIFRVSTKTGELGCYMAMGFCGNRDMEREKIAGSSDGRRNWVENL